MEQRYGTDPSRGYGTGVWNGGMERVWSRSLFRTSYFDLHPYIYIYFYSQTDFGGVELGHPINLAPRQGAETVPASANLLGWTSAAGGSAWHVP